MSQRRIQIWKVVVNILNEQLRTADKGWSYILEFRRGSNNRLPRKIRVLRNGTKVFKLGGS
jgi:hypothetical protein